MQSHTSETPNTNHLFPTTMISICPHSPIALSCARIHATALINKQAHQFIKNSSAKPRTPRQPIEAIPWKRCNIQYTRTHHKQKLHNTLTLEYTTESERRDYVYILAFACEQARETWCSFVKLSLIHI